MSEIPDPESFNPAEGETTESQFEKDCRSFELACEAYKQGVIRQSVQTAPEGYKFKTNHKIILDQHMIKDQIIRQAGFDMVIVHPADYGGSEGDEGSVSVYVSPDDSARYAALEGQKQQHFSDELSYLPDGRHLGGSGLVLYEVLAKPVSLALIDSSRPDSLINSDYGRALKASDKPRQKDLIERAFMTGLLLKKNIMTYLDIRPQELAAYEKLASDGLTPLGIEEIAGLVSAQFNQIWEEHPELRPEQKDDDF